MIGIADADFQGLELGLGDQPWFAGAIQSRRSMRAAKARQEVVHHALRRVFSASGEKVFAHVQLADRIAEIGVAGDHGALPTRASVPACLAGLCS